MPQSSRRMEEGAADQGRQETLEAGKGHQMDSPLEPPEGTWLCGHLDFRPRETNFRLQTRRM